MNMNENEHENWMRERRNTFRDEAKENDEIFDMQEILEAFMYVGDILASRHTYLQVDGRFCM
jgi:hypothetical protein